MPTLALAGSPLRPPQTIGEIAAVELAAGRPVNFTRAIADARGVQLAQMCEATEDDRDWLPGWNTTPWVIIGVGTIGGPA